MAAPTLKVSGDNKDALKKIDQLEKEMAKLERRTKNVGRTSRQSGKSFQEAFGQRSLANLKGFVLGMIGVQKAVSTVASGLADIKRLQDEAFQRARQQEFPLARLSQLVTTGKTVAQQKEELRGFVKAARQTFREGGAATLGEAADVVFALQSAGQLDQREFFSKLAGAGVVQDPAQFAKGAKTLITSLGQKETGNARAVVSKALGASAFSPASAPALLEAAAVGGVSAKQLGFSDEELLAATAITATATGSAEKGGTQIASLLRSFAKRGVQGKTFREAVTDLQARNLTPAQLQKFLGRTEAAQGFNALAGNLPAFDEALAATRLAEEQDEAGKRIRVTSGVPVIRAANFARKRENALTLERGIREQTSAAAEGLQSALFEAIERRERESDTFGAGDAFIRRSLIRTGRFFQGDEGFIRTQTNVNRPDAIGGESAPIQEAREILIETRRQTEVLKETRNEARRRRPVVNAGNQNQ